jgi:hypothetical protein
MLNSGGAARHVKTFHSHTLKRPRRVRSDRVMIHMRVWSHKSSHVECSNVALGTGNGCVCLGRMEELAHTASCHLS